MKRTFTTAERIELIVCCLLLYALICIGTARQAKSLLNTPPGPSDGAAGPSNIEKPPAAGKGADSAAQGGKPGIFITTTKGA